MSATATTTTRSSQRYDAWRQWERRARRQQKSRENLISDNHVDARVYNFMQIEIHFESKACIEESMLRGVIKNTAGGDKSHQQPHKFLGSIYVPTSPTATSTPAPTLPIVKQRRTPNTRTPTSTTSKHTARTIQEESKEHDSISDPESVGGSSLLRVTTSMVLDLQQCLLSQIQLERQDHHLPNELLLQQPQQRIQMPALPPAEASNAASSLSNTTSKSSKSSSIMATCLICPATVQVPSSKHALVYCTNCTTLATASLLRKQQHGKQQHATSSSLSDLSSSIVS